MARNPQANEVERLIARLARSRSEVGEHAVQLRERLNVPKRLRKSLLRHPIAWFGGSLGTGVIASRLLRRRRAAKPARSWFGALLGLAFTFSRPLLQQLFAREFQRRFQGFSGFSGVSDTSQPPAGSGDPGSGGSRRRIQAGDRLPGPGRR